MKYLGCWTLLLPCMIGFGVHASSTSQPRRFCGGYQCRGKQGNKAREILTPPVEAPDAQILETRDSAADISGRYVHRSHIRGASLCTFKNETVQGCDSGVSSSWHDTTHFQFPDNITGIHLVEGNDRMNATYPTRDDKADITENSYTIKPTDPTNWKELKVEVQSGKLDGQTPLQFTYGDCTFKEPTNNGKGDVSCNGAAFCNRGGWKDEAKHPECPSSAPDARDARVHSTDCYFPCL
ncbi:hypothetical protein K491DRAFT_728559 [Lophiostoma macrostomum CBS 122681]|uniref:Uncharacterized protein n=1 Tax=Lophiostoma macrostomum CBS 122681 TaxID=1314788 RepID=A0A6A6TM27_9PLEO|nr:hypothetical protein K491DRAFT_728559 [Lophiostoma macrostomum CBS 122681]